MEKRFYLGVAILVLLLFLSIFTAWGMARIHAPAEAALGAASSLALEEDMEGALSLAQSALERWEKYRGITASVADHAPMDDTENLFAEMQVYACAGESAHFSACCLQLSNMLRAMYDAHSFTLWNLL